VTIPDGSETPHSSATTCAALRRQELPDVEVSVCAAENDLGSRQRQCSRLKLPSRALSIARAIAAAAVNIPLTFLGVPSIVAGVLMAGQTAADCLADGLNDG
jgi:hypothetical protein